MTKCTIIGENPTEEKHPKPIELCILITCSALVGANSSPSSWEYLELVSRDNSEGYDLIFAHDGDRSAGCAYWGYWNDGVV